jgi:hypothetical protein
VQPVAPESEGWKKLKKTVVTHPPFATVVANAPFLVCGQTVFCPQAKRKKQTVNNSQEELTQMKVNQWTLGLAAAGVISFGAVAQAEEKPSHQVLTAVSSTTLSGYVSTSAIWKPGKGNGFAAGHGVAAGALAANSGAVTTGYGLRAYDGAAKHDGFNLDVVNLTVSKPLDEGEWAAGYTAELLLGPDATTYGTGAATVGIKQGYVALNAPVGNGLTFKLGVFDTPIGYEAFNYTANPNYSRSYGFTLEPTTYTGLLASYKVCDAFSVTAGIANNAVTPTPNGTGPGALAVGIGSGGLPTAAINGRTGFESQKTYMGAITVTAPDSLGFLKGSTLTAGVVDHASAGGLADVVNYYAGISLNTPVDALKVGAAFDYQGRSNDKISKAVGASSGFYANAWSLYASYQVTDKLKTALRTEYASGSEGVWYVADAQGLNPNTRNELFGVTGTIDYALWANVITRAEIRWDTALTGGSPSAAGVTGGAKPFGVDDKNALSLALNVIYKF